MIKDIVIFFKQFWSEKGKLLTHTLVIIGLGLLQLWFIMIVLLVKDDEPIKIGELLGDGGLFFFSTSLTVSSALSLFDYRPMKPGTVDINFSLLTAIPVLLIASGWFIAVVSKNGLSTPNPFQSHVEIQIACCTLAIVYWYFVGKRIGLFTEKVKAV